MAVANWSAQHQQALHQAMMGNGPNAGGLGGQGGLAQYQNQLLGQNTYNTLYGSSATVTVYTTVHVYRDPTTNQWIAKICAYQEGEVFVLYNGPFPITKEGLLQHFATLTTEALSEE